MKGDYVGKCNIDNKASGPAVLGDVGGPKVRAENMGHKSGRLGTRTLATSALPAYY